MGLIIAGGSPNRGGRSLALPGTYCQPSLGQVRREGRVYTLKAIANFPLPSPVCPVSFNRDARNDVCSSATTAQEESSSSRARP